MAEFGPTNRAVPSPTSLRPPHTSFFGRVQESEAIRALLLREDIRLVTLTGLGGVGKTRLALRVAEQIAPVLPGGVTTVSLAATRDPGFVLPTIARALGVGEVPETPLTRAMAARLAGRPALLLLDNLEHLPAAAPDISDLLADCPTLTVLATSRALLQISGEHGFPVPPLPLVAADRTPTAKELAASEAGQLFVARARAVRPDFDLTEANCEAIVAICRRVECLPLAIELAAARLRHLPVEALASRLDQRLPLLVGGNRDQPDRLRTMRGAITWSYGLLEPEEQALFRRLAVFTGGFSLPATAAVARLRSEQDALDGIASLIDKSLLRSIGAPDHDARFAMLETLREFGLEALTETGEETDARDRHAAWYVHLAEHARPALEARIGQEPWLQQLEIERDNLRSAMAWLLETNRAGDALRLAASISWFWFVRGPADEARMWLDRALKAASDAPPDDRARALQGMALLAHIQGDDAAGERLADEARRLWETMEDDWGIAEALLYLAVIATARGRTDDAVRHCEEALVHARAARRHANEAMTLHFLGVATWGCGDHERAVAYGEEALALQRSIGDRWGEANTLAYLGLVVGQLGDHRRALDLLRQSLAIRREIGGPEEKLGCLANLGALAAVRGEPELAVRLFGAADASRAALGSTRRSLPERRILGDALDRARSDLGEEAAHAAWDRGATLSVDEALDLALSSAEGGTERNAGGLPETLTSRELEVLRLVASGLTNAQIAERLYISPGTARNHVANILGKLGARTRTEAADIGRRRHLI